MSKPLETAEAPSPVRDIKASYERIIEPPQGVISIRKAYYADLVVQAHDLNFHATFL